MHISYDRLWTMLFNRNTSKMDFARNVDISNATLAKLGKDEPVSLTVLLRICERYNCKIEDIVEFKPDKQDNQFPDITSINIGTILMCSHFQVGSSIKDRSMQKRKNYKKDDKQPCVVLQKIFRENLSPYLLVAPLSYEYVPDSILSVEFKNLKIENITIEKGYIQVGKVGYAYQKHCKKPMGRMPIQYMNDALEMLEKIKTIVDLDS